MFSSDRTVLLMTDEALYIYNSKSRAVDMVEHVPWDHDSFSQTVATAIAQKCSKAPILILNDMVEQHYRKERVLTSGVSLLDRKAMVTRKLNMAFPNYPVRAALPLKEKVKKEAGSMGSDVFIFAAIPSTQQLTQTISIVNKSMASSKGMGLLPVESASLVKKLAKKLQAKKATPAQWVLQIGQHRNGGLRQIVIKNGEVALTRMTPLPLTAKDDVVAWSKEVVQEFQATMSYLTRFGFRPEDGLDVILLSSADSAEQVRTQVDDRFNFQTLTPAEASKALGLKLNIKEDDYFSDILHVAWAAKKTKLDLPMSSLTLDQVAKPRQIANGAITLLLISSLFLAYQVVNYASLNAEADSDIKARRIQNNTLQIKYEAELKKNEALGIDVRLIQGTLQVFQERQNNNLQPLVVIKAMGNALGGDLRLSAINMRTLIDSGKQQKAPQSFGFGGALQVEYASEATVQIIYPSTADVERGNAEIQTLKDEMQKELSGYEVEVTKFLKDFQYVEEIIIDSDDDFDDSVEQDYIAEITIKKPTATAGGLAQ